MSNYSSNDVANAIAAAAKALDARKDEINRLNVFPVPDGDTGTNMSLTLLPWSWKTLPRCRSALRMPTSVVPSPPARSWVHAGIAVSSPRRSCVVCAKASMAMKISISMRSAMLSLKRSKSPSTRYASQSKARSSRCCATLRKRPAPPKKNRPSLEEYLQNIVNAAYASVQRTPDLLPVLKENGVVDAGWLWPCDLLRLVRCCSYRSYRGARR